MIVNITIKDIDDLQNHLSEAICARIDQKLDGMANRLNGVETTQAAQGNAIDGLKKNQAKALVGWTVLVMGVTLLFNHIKSWLLARVHLN